MKKFRTFFYGCVLIVSVIVFSALSCGVGPIFFTVEVNNLSPTAVTIRVDIDGDGYGPYAPGAIAQIFVTAGCVVKIFDITDNVFLLFAQDGPWAEQKVINSDVVYNIKRAGLFAYVEIVI